MGLVGRNGAGRSTLVKLLCRFYDPERGAILWDGVDRRRTQPSPHPRTPAPVPTPDHTTAGRHHDSIAKDFRANPRMPR